MAADFLINESDGSLVIVHDEDHPKINKLIILSYDECSDLYARHAGYVHRFIGKIGPELANSARACSRAIEVQMAGAMVAYVGFAHLGFWSHRTFRSSLLDEVSSRWSAFATENGCSQKECDEGKRLLSLSISQATAETANLGPFPVLENINRSLEGNTAFLDQKEDIRRPSGGLATTRTARAIRNFASEEFMRI